MGYVFDREATCVSVIVEHIPWATAATTSPVPARAFLAPEPDSKPDIGAAMKTQARIAGTVEYREGDGANITIRPGPCEVDETALDAMISWTDGDSHGSAAMPIADYRSHLASGAIRIDGKTGS